MKKLVILTALLLTACSTPASSKEKAQADIHPFVGCWKSADGLGTEGWTQAPNGWLFGYAMNLNEAGEMVFYEQMRVERDGGKDVLFVTGGEDVAPIPFTREPSDKTNLFRFVNAAHDHPQVITYHRDGDFLNAEIAKLDGSGLVKFPKSKCS